MDDDDEVRRARLARLGHTPESWEEMLANIPTVEGPAISAEELASRPGISFFEDGSVIERHEDGAETVRQLPYAKRPDAQVHQLPERGEDR